MKLFIIIFSFGLICCTKVFGQNINKILIEGNQRIETTTIMTYLDLDKNKDIDVSDLNLVFKELFASDLFSEILFDLKDR